MPERALFYQYAAFPFGDRDVATEIQRGTAEEITVRNDALSLCQTTGEKAVKLPFDSKAECY